MKTCSKCGFVGEDELFIKKGKICKKCQNRYLKRYREKNRDKVVESQKRYYEENKEKVIKRNKRYYEENREKYLEYLKKYHKKYSEENREKTARRQKRYREENKEKMLKREKRYREENREKLNEYSRQHFKEMSENITDAYISRILRVPIGLIKETCPEVLSIKRRQLQLHRILKEFKTSN